MVWEYLCEGECPYDCIVTLAALALAATLAARGLGTHSRDYQVLLNIHTP